MEARKEAGDDIGDGDTEMRVDMEKNNITKLPEEGGGAPIQDQAPKNKSSIRGETGESVAAGEGVL